MYLLSFINYVFRHWIRSCMCRFALDPNSKISFEINPQLVIRPETDKIIFATRNLIWTRYIYIQQKYTYFFKKFFCNTYVWEIETKNYSNILLFYCIKKKKFLRLLFIKKKNFLDGVITHIFYSNVNNEITMRTT